VPAESSWISDSTSLFLVSDLAKAAFFPYCFIVGSVCVPILYFGETIMTHASGGNSNPFTASEWAELQAEDRHAAGNIVRLLTAIFVIGILMYSLVCTWIIQNWS
jgi:hypothetical protein